MFASTNSSAEDLYDWYFVLDGLEKGIEAQFSCEAVPGFPVGIGGGGLTSRDSALHIFLRKAEITEEVTCGERGT